MIVFWKCIGLYKFFQHSCWPRVKLFPSWTKQHCNGLPLFSSLMIEKFSIACEVQFNIWCIMVRSIVLRLSDSLLFGVKCCLVWYYYFKHNINFIILYRYMTLLSYQYLCPSILTLFFCLIILFYSYVFLY